MSNCHNHQHCIDDALAAAHLICNQQNAKLTELRQQVLLLIWENHKPLGAYTLIDQLAEKTQRRIAPPTVYRTLEFLLELGLIHRINSLNAYIGCSQPHMHQTQSDQNAPNQVIDKHNYFLICKKCHDTQEILDAKLSKKIELVSQTYKFLPQEQWLEITGLCEECS
jgi:Fur family zinc uptake transcriptional regulator